MIDIEKIYKENKKAIKALYITGSRILPYIHNPIDYDYAVIKSANSGSTKDFYRLKDIREIVKSIYVYELKYMKLLYGEDGYLPEIDILNEKEKYMDILRQQSVILLKHKVIKKWYHIYTMLCIIENNSYDFTEEQINHINNLHDKIIDQEAIDWCKVKLGLIKEE